MFLVINIAEIDIDIEVKFTAHFKCIHSTLSDALFDFVTKERAIIVVMVDECACLITIEQLYLSCSYYVLFKYINCITKRHIITFE